MNKDVIASFSGAKAPELTERDIQILIEKASGQFINELQLPDTDNIQELAEDVVRKCLVNAAKLLDDPKCWLGDEAKTVRALIEIAVESTKLIPYERDPMINISSTPRIHSKADKKALADAIQKILEEQASNSPEKPYT